MDDVSEFVRTFVDGGTPAKRRRDAETLLELMARATGESPQLYYGNAVAYGQDVGCLYIKDLKKIDVLVLEAIVTESYRTLTSDTYTLRAREGTPALPDE